MSWIERSYKFCKFHDFSFQFQIWQILRFFVKLYTDIQKSAAWNHTIRTRILREYGHTRTYRVPRHATCPPRVRNRIRSDSDLTRVMENPVSGYVIGTRRVETWKFPCTFRFAANNVRYTSAWSVSLRLSFRVFLKTVFPNVVRIVSLGVLVPKFHGTRRIDLYSRTRFSTVLRESLSIQKPEIRRYLKNRLGTGQKV